MKTSASVTGGCFFSQIWYAISNQTGGGMSMEEQQNPLTYEIIKAAVAGEKWATERFPHKLFPSLQTAMQR